MTAYVTPTSGQAFPDIQTDWPPTSTQPNGSPPVPGTSFAGPLLAGTVPHSDGTTNLAGVGGTTGVANRGYVQMAQSCVCTQATNTGTAGQFACPIVIPAQSQILHITIMVTAALTGSATTMGIGSGASATAFTAASAVVTSGALGQVSVTPGTGATQIGNWDNVGTQDVQIVVLSTNTGSGVFTLTVEYVQSINLAS
jgi:hypothetical protein